MPSQDEMNEEWIKAKAVALDENLMPKVAEQAEMTLKQLLGEANIQVQKYQEPTVASITEYVKKLKDLQYIRDLEVMGQLHDDFERIATRESGGWTTMPANEPWHIDISRPEKEDMGMWPEKSKKRTKGQKKVQEANEAVYRTQEEQERLFAERYSQYNSRGDTGSGPGPGGSWYDSIGKMQQRVWQLEQAFDAEKARMLQELHESQEREKDLQDQIDELWATLKELTEDEA